MGFALTASPFCQTATKGTKKALPCHTAVSLWLDGAFTPALLRGHAVTGHPWPSTAGSAPADPPPQQHLRSACCEGPLRCACNRVAAGRLFKIKIKIKIKIKFTSTIKIP